MAEQPRRDSTGDDTTLPSTTETRETEQERIRSSNDRDQEMEREGLTSRHNRGYDEAVRGTSLEEIDPDSPRSEVERDDAVEE